MKKKNNEFNPYATDKLAHIPTWIKVLFLKYWVAAATLFFFGIGNPILLSEGEYGIEKVLPLYLWLAIGLTLFNEFISRPMLRLMHSPQDETSKFNFVNVKGIPGVALDFIYSALIMIPMVTIMVFLARNNINLDFIDQSGSKAAVEPFTGGFVYLFVDGICLLIKNGLIYLHKERKYKQINQRNEDLVNRLESLSDEDLIALDEIQRGVKNEI